jgi:hypothetical protein
LLFSPLALHLTAFLAISTLPIERVLFSPLALPPPKTPNQLPVLPYHALAMGEKIGENVEGRDEYAFVRAARDGDLKEISKLVASGIDVNVCVENSMLLPSLRCSTALFTTTYAYQSRPNLSSTLNELDTSTNNQSCPTHFGFRRNIYIMRS